MINCCGINNTLSSSCPTLSKPRYQFDLDNSSLNSSPTHIDLSSTFDSACKHKTGFTGHSMFLAIIFVRVLSNLFAYISNLFIWFIVTNSGESKENETMRRKSWAALDDLTKNNMFNLQIVKRQKR